jgi:hypothetical protein
MLLCPAIAINTRIPPPLSANLVKNKGIKVKLSLRSSLLTAVSLLVILLIVNSTKYVYPDFISVSVGSLGGFYIGGWIVWLVAKNFVSAERVDKRFLIFAVAATLLFLNIFSAL